MYCPQCGKPYPESTRFCPACGAAVSSEEAVTPDTPEPAAREDTEATQPLAAPDPGDTMPMAPIPPGGIEPQPALVPDLPPLPRRRTTTRFALGTFSIVLLVTLGGFFCWQWGYNAPLNSLVPQQSALLATADGRWCWDTSADLRKLPEVRDLLDGMTEETGLTLEEHVAPWIGQIAFSLSSLDGETPSGTCYIQIRDKSAFLRSMKKLESALAKMTDEQKATITIDHYRGVRIQRVVMKEDDTEVDVASTGGWLIASVGDHEIERIIDVHAGKAPSIAKNAMWKRAQRNLAKNPVATVSFTGDGMMKMLPSTSPYESEMRRFLSKYEMDKYVATYAFYDTGNGLRFDMAGVTDSAKLKGSNIALRREVGTVNGTSFAYLPKDTVATLLIPRPGKWLHAVKEFMLEAAPDEQTRASITEGFTSIAPVQQNLDRCTGECGIGVSWNERNGLGVVACGETGSAGDAAKITGDLNGYIEGMGMSVQKTGARYVMEMPEMSEGPVKAKPCWETKERWLRVGLHPNSLASSGAELQIPAAAKDASLLIMGNCSFVSPLLKQLGEGPEGSMGNMVSDLQLDKAQWSAFLTIDPDGKCMRSTVEIRNWDWHKALNTLTNQSANR